MAQREVVLLDRKDSPWDSFLKEYFEDTKTSFNYFSEASKAGAYLDSHPVHLFFLNPSLETLSLIQKLKFLRQTKPAFRLFQIGESGTGKTLPPDFPADGHFPERPDSAYFQKHLMKTIIFECPIRILGIDDEDEIKTMLENYFENRTNPVFDFHYAPHGKAALEMMQKKAFDVIILDLKMPVMDGQEFYREITSRKIETPVIIFFDAFFDNELARVHEYGNPAVVEKGSWTGTMPEMMTLVKKKAYFG